VHKRYSSGPSDWGDKLSPLPQININTNTNLRLHRFSLDTFYYVFNKLTSRYLSPLAEPKRQVLRPGNLVPRPKSHASVCVSQSLSSHCNKECCRSMSVLRPFPCFVVVRTSETYPPPPVGTPVEKRCFGSWLFGVQVQIPLRVKLLAYLSLP
jgi:hypothetical protein